MQHEYVVVFALAKAGGEWTRWAVVVDAGSFQEAEAKAAKIYGNFLISGRPKGEWPEQLVVDDVIAVPQSQSNADAA